MSIVISTRETSKLDKWHQRESSFLQTGKRGDAEKKVTEVLLGTNQGKKYHRRPPRPSICGVSHPSALNNTAESNSQTAPGKQQNLLTKIPKANESIFVYLRRLTTPGGRRGNGGGLV
jgi:hypothetical protein